MGFQKGKSGNPAGRPKGIPNRSVLEIKDAIMTALHAGDGAEGFMMRLKEERPELFTKLVSQVLPKDIHLKAEIEGVITIARSFVVQPSRGDGNTSEG